ncbi:hypothetical protein P170DRAFT_475441 [Aspergillus steynii IBT 23096]|uniref:Transcriptional regulator n=1 Tax=Aspergillus steynii IBT 23096 TaxID=1392250 RepID=A0A2I2G8D0_9EURO|nr:uncharacterized protein P170DRAFT_475441 [Aspergillus steynii IBT 23096]PLB49125.1 hypothetical protein P170DRAFT_475441 [Aspergillus steynii IBT 23096]
MFLPSVHAETDRDVLLQFIRENPLGMLITGINSSQHSYLQCTHVPFVLDAHDDSNASEPRLRAHIAKKNPQAQALIEGVDNKPPSILDLDDEVLVVFNGKHDHYVTPKFYTETKPATGKVVPTWNYTAVQVYGKLSLYYDSKSPDAGAFLAKQIHDLSEHAERSIVGHTGDGNGARLKPWKVSDAPGPYLALMKRNIVGIEIKVTKIEGKFKMSQEMRPGDRQGVVDGFGKIGGDTGDFISDLVKERGEIHDQKKGERKK